VYGTWPLGDVIVKLDLPQGSKFQWL